MTTTHKQDKKTNFSYFIFHFSLLLMFTSVASADFTRDNNTKIVTDNETGLQWQDDKNVTKTWQNAIKYCEALTLGGYDDWRLPNRNEIYSIVDETQARPSISPVFQFSSYKSYWSSTSCGDGAWVIRFSIGDQYTYHKISNNHVRCVRAGQ